MIRARMSIPMPDDAVDELTRQRRAEAARE